MGKSSSSRTSKIPMRDGCVLRRLFRPDSPEKLPVIHQSDALQTSDADGVRAHDGFDSRGERRLPRA